MLPVSALVRHGARSLRRTPAFTIAAVVTLALGIGATAAIFSVVNGVLLRPLSFAEPDRLVGVWFAFPGVGVPQAMMSDGTYFVFRRENRVFDEMGLYQEDAVNVTWAQEPERVTAAAVTASLIPTLRVAPLRGRLIAEGEDRPNQRKVALIGEGLWRRKFGADPSIVGRVIQIDGVGREVVGVMPAAFRFPNERTQIWLPLVLDPAHAQVASFNYNGIARLKPGQTIDRAVSDLEAMMKRMPDVYPEAVPGVSTRDMLKQGHESVLVHSLRDDVVGDVGRVLWVVLGTIAFVLLAACTNVANLFLVRAEGRQRELAVRSALGAGWSEAARRFVTEALLLAATGGVLGTALAYAGLGLLVRAGGQDIPRIGEVAVDATTLGVTALVTVIVALVCSLFPILRFTARDLSPLLRDGRSSTGGRERQRARSVLVVSQVALALVLLAASGLMARSFWALRGVKPGFDASHALALRLSLSGPVYEKPDRVARFWEEAADRIGALPGVRAVGAATKLPLAPDGDSHSAVWIEDHPMTAGEMPPIMLQISATGGYFQAAGIPLVAGRTFGRSDGSRPVPEAIVSRAMAAHWFGDSSGRAAVGRRLRRSPEPDNWYTIVGVVGDVRVMSLDKPAEETAYFPPLGYAGRFEFTPTTMSLVVRTMGEPTAIAAAAERAVHGLDPSQPIFNVRAMEEVARQSMARTSFTMLMLGLAAGVAIVLGVVGIYGVVSYTVSLRTREIGVRIALGARPTQVGGMVARQAGVVALVGIGVGLAGALVLTRFMSTLLYGVSPTDPLALGGAAVLLLASAFIASWLPARRASRVDPVTALRAD